MRTQEGCGGEKKPDRRKKSFLLVFCLTRKMKTEGNETRRVSQAIQLKDAVACYENANVEKTSDNVF